MPKLFLVVGAVTLLSIGQDVYAAGDVWSAMFLLLLGALTMFLVGYAAGMDVRHVATKAPDDHDEPRVGGSA